MGGEVSERGSERGWLCESERERERERERGREREQMCVVCACDRIQKKSISISQPLRRVLRFIFHTDPTSWIKEASKTTL